MQRLLDSSSTLLVNTGGATSTLLGVVTCESLHGYTLAGTASFAPDIRRYVRLITAKLMKRLYSGELGPSQLRPAAALRAAQLSLARDARWGDPYYWAGFVLQGDWQ